MNEAELQWVQLARGGDRDAFGKLAKRYRGSVLAAARALCADPEEAAELTQETFVRALAKLPHLEDPAKFEPWLRGIAYTLGRDVRRKAARERKHLAAAAHQNRPRPQAPDVILAEREALDRDLSLLADLVDSLPQNCRLALDLRYREGLSYAAIAEALGVPPSTVRGLLYRATKALRTKMRPMLRKRGGAE